MTLLLTPKKYYSNSFYSYDKKRKLSSYNVTRTICALNDSHIMVNQMEYRKILLIKYHLYKWEMWLFFLEFKK
jgi:hypothetical protein